MKTRSYSIARVVTQTLAVFSIVSNVVAYGAVYFSNIEKVTILLDSKPTFDFCDMGSYLCAVNVLLAVISVCCVTSKLKIWMKLCQKMLLLSVGCISCIIAYFFVWYPSSLVNSVSTVIFSKGNSLMPLLRSIGVMPCGGIMITGFQKYIEFYIRIYCCSQIGSLLCTMGIVKLLRYSSTIELEVKRRELPKMSQASRLGSSARILELRNIPVGPIPVR